MRPGAKGEAAARLASVSSLALPPLLPSSTWLGGSSMASVPLDTSTQQCSTRVKAEGLHVVELFGGIELGMLRRRWQPIIQSSVIHMSTKTSSADASLSLLSQPSCYKIAHCLCHPFL